MPTTATEKLVDLFPAGSERVYVSNSVFTSSRIAGTPSKLLPSLRDLCIDPVVHLRNGEVKPTITIEIDTQHQRQVGVIKNYSKRGGDEMVYLKIEQASALHPGEIRTSVTPIKFENILAFRLIKVEIPESAL